MTDVQPSTWREVASFAWQNRKEIGLVITTLKEWMFTPAGSTVLILGPGGVGKSTLGKLLSGDYQRSLEIPGDYAESSGLEHFQLLDDKNVEIVVAPGQEHRRDATWGSLEADIAGGKYRGVIVLAANGYHTLGGEVSYKDHRLYSGDEGRFLEAYLAERRSEEEAVLSRLLPHIKNCGRDKFWILPLITKQDLWWPHQADVVRHYREGRYGSAVKEVTTKLGSNRFRYEFVFGALTIANFRTGRGEVLAPTAEGYEQQLQVQSVRRLWETLFALKAWEES